MPEIERVPELRDDLALLTDAALAAADIALDFQRNGYASREKPGLGPVTDADLAVDAMLRARLTAARPGYGWLSEESEDTPDRLAAHRVFLVDPIDGTRDFIAGGTAWCHALAVVERGQVVAGVVHLPRQHLTYAATLGGGATRGGAPIRASRRSAVSGARVLASAAGLVPHAWPGGVPPVDRGFRPSLAYRLCLVADGRFDATLVLRDCWEWDVAAGALIAAEAGAVVTGRDGEDLAYNGPGAKVPGLVAAGPALHAGLLALRHPANSG